MNYYSKETATKLMQKEIEIMKAALLHQESIKSVIKKFNNKVFNKKLNTALEEIDKRISIQNSEYSFSITYTAWDYTERSIQLPSLSGYNHTVYVNNNSVNIAYMSLRSNRHEEPHALDECKRIRSDAIIDNINLQCDKINNQVALLESEIENIDATLKEFERIKSEQQTFINSVNYVTRQYFDIEF